MFNNRNGKFVTKTIKDEDGVNFEFFYYLELSKEEIDKLQYFRKNFATTSTIHFHFEAEKFLFSQKKYFKKEQFVKNPPELDVLESYFFEDIKTSLTQFSNFLNFEKIEHSETSKEVSINDISK